MKKARLDQILLRRGAASEEQIHKALLRQKSRGGRLGTHLLFYRFFTEDELVEALAEQYQIRGICLGGIEIPDDVVKKLPPGPVEEYLAIPFRHDRGAGELHVAIADPENPNALTAIRRASGIPNVVLHVAPEAMIRDKIAFHYHGRRQNPALSHVIDLPDLFADGENHDPALPDEPAEEHAGAKPGAKILMFTRQVFLKNVLPSVFEREGLNLSIATSPAEVAESLRAARCDRILFSEEVRQEFERFTSEHGSRTVLPEATSFRTVGSALLESPVPYDNMFECLLAAVRYIADTRTPDPSRSPPYALISKEITEVGRSVGLGRVAIDGLRLVAHSLIPQNDSPEGASDAVRTRHANLFGDLEKPLEIVKHIGFPWDLAACINALKDVLSGIDGAPGPMEEKTELPIAAGVLSLVWFRHHILRSLRGGSRGDLDALKSELRHQAGRLAPSSVVESYIRTLELSDLPAGTDKDILVVGDVDSLSTKLMTELKHHGFRIVEADSLPEAQKIYLRRRPAAILIHVDRSLPDADRFCRHIREDLGDTDTTLFAVTRRNEPSFLLNLLDTWFSDVLPLPMDNPVAVARITKALSARETGTGGPIDHGFSATFRDLSFTDLAQTLGAGVKNVRMRIEHSSGRQAEIFFRQGRIVFAACGEDRGPEAVYRVIRWKEEGSFRIEPTVTFPADNVPLPTDYILLEGSRLLDEERTGA